MKIFILLAGVGLLLMTFTGCVSTLLTGAAMGATMTAGVEKSASQKTGNSLVTVHIPISKFGTSAMLTFVKDTAQDGTNSTWEIKVRYASSLKNTMYELLRFTIDGAKYDLNAGRVSTESDQATMMLQGLTSTYNYTTDLGQNRIMSVLVDSAIASTLVAAIITGKQVQVQNFEKGSDSSISYTFSSSDQVLFKNLQ